MIITEQMDAAQNRRADARRNQIEEFFAKEFCAFLTEIFAASPVHKGEGSVSPISTNEVGLTFDNFAVKLLAALQRTFCLLAAGDVYGGT
jgi:hypothetical protein